MSKMMPPPSSTSRRTSISSVDVAKSQLDLQRKKGQFRQDIFVALHESEDPLEAYSQFVNWMQEQTKSASRDSNLHAEMIELLEEATRSFKDDMAYKQDRRYLKLWILYAELVETPSVVLSYLLSNDIGTAYSQTYEELALALECEGRLAEAESAYVAGIKRGGRPLERLRNRYSDFRDRVASSATLKGSKKDTKLASKLATSTRAEKLRRQPLSDFFLPTAGVKQVASSKSTEKAPAGASTSRQDPYQHMTAATQQPQGRRPEKLRFNINLLFRDGNEFCVQEARARSLGLLDKKWAPPPQSEPGTHQRGHIMTAQVNFNDAGTKSSWKNNGRTSNVHITMSLPGNEPTVTLNTKEALKDVFGMFNSPDRSVKLGPAVMGSKHAPVKKIEPLANSTSSRTNADDNLFSARKATDQAKPQNENAAKPKLAFQPFVESESVSATPKFKPFVDENVDAKTPFGSSSARKGLTLKDVSTPKHLGNSSKEELLPTTPGCAPLPTRGDEVQDMAALRVFTPAPSQDVLRSSLAKTPEPRVGRDDAEEPAKPTKRLAVFRDDDDESPPLNVFSMPEQHEQRRPRGLSIETPSSQNFQVFSSTPTASSSRTPGRPFDIFTDDDEPEQEPEEEPQQTQEEYVDEEEYYTDEQVPMGGRLGQFDVMTPITERTFEYTMSTRAFSTPASPQSDKSGSQGRVFVRPDDADGYARGEEDKNIPLLRRSLIKPYVDPEDEASGSGLRGSESQSFADNDADDLVERTGTLSLIDALAVASSFKPPNPCVPTDPHIISTLLALSPLEAEFHDFPTETSDLLDDLQKFAAKRSRNSGSAPDEMPIRLNEHRFDVSEKLGEGAFGAVFRAKVNKSDVDEDDYDGDFDEDEDANIVAIKVVKPRNLWEYHILRRVHNALPPRPRQSIINPQALYAYRDESFLVMDFSPQGTLINVVNNAATAGISQQGACLDELLVMFFGIELLRFVEGIHSIGFIHGDIKIDNCLLRLDDIPEGASTWSSIYQPSGEGGWKYKGIRMIDFGKSVDTRMFPPGQKFMADWDADAKDCMEIRNGQPWTYQTDYHGVAGVIYCMLYGKYFDAGSIVADSTAPSTCKLATQFKRYWQVDLWTRLFHLLLNSGQVRQDGSLPICTELSSIRNEMESWLQSNCNRGRNSLKGLLKKVELIVL